MNFKIINKNTFLVKINTSYKTINGDNQSKVIKDILLLIKKRFAFNINGFYEVNIYNVDKLLTVLLFKKLNDEESYYNTIDLKIVNHTKKLDIVIDDFILKNNKEIYKICEHYSIKDLNLQY